MWASKAARSDGSLAVNAAIRTDTGSLICSKIASRSASSTARRATSGMPHPNLRGQSRTARRKTVASELRRGAPAANWARTYSSSRSRSAAVRVAAIASS